MSESTSPEKLEQMAARIRALLAKAERTDNEAEAAAYMAKAEELRDKYRIEEETLIASDQFSLTPVTREIKISDWSSKFRFEHWTMWYYTASHTGCRTDATYRNGDLIAIVVGYESDIRHAEMLYMSAWLTMVAKLEPQKSADESEAENIYRLRSSGKTRRQVAKIMWGIDTHASHAKVAKIYQAECDRRGEKAIVSGKGLSNEVFQDTYADAFVQRYARRLREARDAADSVSGGLTLHGRKERVDEAFYLIRPQARPETPEQREARLAEEAKADKGKKTKAPKPYKVTKAAMDRYHRENYSAAALAGKEAGRSAADQVELQRTTPSAQRVEAGEPGKLSQLPELGN